MTKTEYVVQQYDEIRKRWEDVRPVHNVTEESEKLEYCYSEFQRRGIEPAKVRIIQREVTILFECK